MSSAVHSIAQTGFGSGTNELYDRARPSYQPLALSHIRDAVKTTPINVVEVGAGTGIFTRAFLAHPQWTSALNELRAVEPSKGMCDVFTKNVSDERVSITQGTFEKTGIEDGWADIVIVAQAFHWCPDFARASAEFARILKPTGVLALIWNLEDRDSAKWVAQVRDRIERHENGSPQFRLGLWRQAFATAAYQESFEPPQEKTWSAPLPATHDIVVDRACSKSYIAILPDEEKAKVRVDLEVVVEKGEGKVWINESEGTFEYPYKTYLVIAQKKV